MDLGKLIKANYSRLGIDYVGPPRNLSQEEKEFRVSCITEELNEYINAETLEDKYDALLDLSIFVAGTMTEHGFPVNPGLLTVMLSNFQKQVGQNAHKERSKKGWQIDLIKPPGFKPADVGSILNSPVDNDTSIIKRSPRVLVLGHARHGKDTFADWLIPNQSPTSLMALDLFLFEKLQSDPNFINKYSTIEDAYEDRANNRVYWHESIKEYNTPDWSRFAKEVFRMQSMYVGMRAVQEYQSCIQQGLFDVIYWVDRSDHLDNEPITSMTIHYDPSRMILIDNNGTLEQLKSQAIFHSSLLLSTFPRFK